MASAQSRAYPTSEMKKFIESMGSLLLPRKPNVRSPEQEIRFTRSGQAMLFVGLGVFFFCCCLALLVLNTSGFTEEPPVLNSFWWAAIPFPFMMLSLWTAFWLTRHAYLILSPLGVEIFPFFQPAKNFRVVHWSEIEGALLDEDKDTLVLDLLGGSKIFLTTKPIRKDRRPLLKRAIEGTLAKQAKPVEEPNSIGNGATPT